MCELCGTFYRSCTKHDCNEIKLSTAKPCHKIKRKTSFEIKTNCNFCGDAVFDIKKHLFTVHRKGNFKCTDCDKLLYSEVGLNKHYITEHNLNKVYECSICEQKFKKKTHCDSHSKKHNPIEKDLMYCAECPFSTTSLFALNRHRKTHVKHTTKCTICFKLFKNNSSLRNVQETISSLSSFSVNNY